MRDRFGNHVAAVDEYGYAATDNIAASVSVHGHLVATYADHIDKVCVEIGTNGPTYAGMSMHLALDKAIALRAMLDAAIDDALRAQVLELPAGGGVA